MRIDLYLISHESRSPLLHTPLADRPQILIMLMTSHRSWQQVTATGWPLNPPQPLLMMNLLLNSMTNLLMKTRRPVPH